MNAFNPGDWWPAIVNFALLLIWGGQMNQRVKSLEAEISALKDMDSRMARVETRLEALYEQFKELNASIRWMRQPAAYPVAKADDR
jgi:hypothetical protein